MKMMPCNSLEYLTAFRFRLSNGLLPVDFHLWHLLFHLCSCVACVGE